MRKKAREFELYVAGVCVVLGVLLVAQFRTQEYIGRAQIPSRRLEDLSDMLRRSDAERELLEKEVDALRKQLAAVGEGERAAEAVRLELEKARMGAGLVAVEGPGVTVVLDDSKRQAEPGESPEVFLVHDEDILKIVNELFAAGAEAISINGQRVIATTEVRCAGPVISVNNVRIGPPYEITAIGDPTTLDNALRMRDGILDTLRTWGIEAKVQKVTTVRVPAYKGSLYFQYAKPVLEGAQK
ncbi:MAG: DUF881 domain-containing protein [Bacillota bacterium]